MIQLKSQYKGDSCCTNHQYLKKQTESKIYTTTQHKQNTQTSVTIVLNAKTAQAGTTSDGAASHNGDNDDSGCCRCLPMDLTLNGNVTLRTIKTNTESLMLKTKLAVHRLTESMFLLLLFTQFIIFDLIVFYVFVFPDFGLSDENSIAIVCRGTFGVEIGSHEHFTRVENLKNCYKNETCIILASQDVTGWNRKSCHVPINEVLKIPLTFYKSIQNGKSL